MGHKPNQRRKLKRTLTLFVLISFLIHTVALVTWTLWQRRGPQVAKKEKHLKVRLNPSPKKKMQVVQQKPDPQKEPDNKEADFWSLQNKKVEKQTKAQRIDDFKNTPVPPQLAVPQKQKSPPKKQKKKKSKIAKSHGRIPVRDHKKIVKNLFKTLDDELMKRQPAVTSSATDDYLKKIDVGNQTALNTREFKYYSYFERVRRQLKQYWRPLIREKFNTIAFQQNRLPASKGEKITRVKVILDRDGNISQILILKSSGVGMIDTAAVEAFEKAGPFPNPPKGMIEKDGSVRLQWEFVLVINA